MGRPKIISVLDKILGLAETPEPEKVPPPRKRKFYRHMTDRQRKMVEEGNHRRAAASKQSQMARAHAYPLAPLGVRRRGRFRGVKWPIGERAIDRIVLLMDPGRWYAGNDLLRGIGEPITSTGPRMLALRQKRLVVRRQNTAWPKVLNLGMLCGTLTEPRWLYRLTELGEVTRGYLVLLAV